jgi:HPt (histidine-containing phosphotransfer) domain-containing protein
MLETTTVLIGPEEANISRATLLERFAGDDDLLREITAIFLIECPVLLERIRGAVESRNCKELEIAAHSLKGAASNFGAAAAIDGARAVEMIGRRGSLAEAPAAVAALESCLNDLNSQLANLLL